MLIAEFFTEGVLLFLRDLSGIEHVEVDGVRDHVDRLIDARLAEVFLAFFGGPGDLLRQLREQLGILVGKFRRGRYEWLGRDIIDVLVVHRVQRVDERDAQHLGDHHPRQPDAELVVDMDDVGTELIDVFEPRGGERHGHAVAVEALGGVGRAVEDAVGDIVPARGGVGGDDQDLVPELFQPVLEGFDVGDDPVDMGEVGFCKKCNTHGTRSCSFGVVVCGCGFRQLPDDRGPAEDRTSFHAG